MLEVEGHSYLGIYLTKDAATVVCLSGKTVSGCFSVTIKEKEKQNPQDLARLIAEGCAKRNLKFSEAAVALDCSMFMQHNVHSKFSDLKQITSTVRFDAEEVLGMDITELALAFKVASSGSDGSSLTVFTAQKKLLFEILSALQGNGFDPVTIEPDANCLAGFLLQNVSPQPDSHPLFCLLSDSSGYFIALSRSRETSAMRTFLVRPSQDRNDLLAREIPVTAALVESDKPVNSIKVFDSTGSVNLQQLGERMGLFEIGDVDLLAAAETAPEVLADCRDHVGFAIAYGAALSHSEKIQNVNFRNDFAPYQGGKVRLQNTVKLASLCAVVLMLAAGVFFQLQLWQENKYRARLFKKLQAEYSAVMFGKKPASKSDAVKKLESELRRIENVKKGLLSVTGEEAITAKLTLVLEAFNKCAAQTNLNIDSISISTKTISIAGDTSSRASTLKLFDAIKTSGLDIQQQNLGSKGGRDNFSITVGPKK
ncbi:MAG: hypothetical protein JW947_11265 [Sedimentisphaerales bacterium]|nr:hypothetical protein [Sedimentisphaerales bacterium]